MISENGTLIIEEVYYNSYLLPKLTSSIIFYIMKLLTFIHFDSIHTTKDYKSGLQVNFFNESELEECFATMFQYISYTEIRGKYQNYIEYFS
jgi:hypothetical protein